MEVFLGHIPKHLDAAAIEPFIFALVQKECRLTTTSASGISTVALVPLNKDFYFRRVDTYNELDFGIITFASRTIALWFLVYSQSTRFVRKHGLVVSAGRKTPSAAFVRAIAENATDKEPSASARKQDQFFSLRLALVGHWAANKRFSYTHSFTGDDVYLVIDEQNVISVSNGTSSVSFLPRDVKAYRCDKTHDAPTAILFELNQNPRLRGEVEPSKRTPHHFNLPTRLVHVTFYSDYKSRSSVKRFAKLLADDLLKGVPNLPMQDLQVVKDNNDTLIAGFFRKSGTLDIELAFLRESLLRNELLGTSALFNIIDKSLNELLSRGQYTLALRVLKNLVPKLEARQERGNTDEQIHCFTKRLWEEACEEAVANDGKGLLTFMEPSHMKGDTLMSPFLHIDLTPTRVLLSGPHWHMSNRVIRSYPGHWDHFARLSITSESREGATTITPNYGFDDAERYIRGRVLDILKNGIIVAGRRFQLLAWSSSSMSSHTVWFVTPFLDATGRLVDANSVRKSLGNFKDVIRKPAMYGARLSQAFSATATTIKIPKEHIHTDGVGQISPALMADVWESYLVNHGEFRKRKLLKASAPSAIQIRLGGSKGMLSLNPRLTGKVLYIRPSMSKFDSQHQDLEVANSSSRCLTAKLNRPLVNALDDRGVHASAFIAIQDEAISQIGRARHNFDETARLVSAFSFGTGCNLRILFEKVHKVGLGAASTDPESFFLVLAKAVTAAALGDMKRKARIPVAGVTLLGIADEFGYLKEGEVFVQVETVDFGQVSRRILTGRKLIGRSPTIDPSDITMVQCKKPPPGHPLLQLRNVVVFNTCTRLQPLPRRLGGGDLDGDLYTIYEDERLFPPTPQPEAVFHAKVEAKELSHPCNAHDLADFFADFMLNDFVGLVSSLHLRISDASEAGAADPRCKTLAKLHSQATDFRKTGVAVKHSQLPPMHEPIVPDFLAQSEKREGKLVYSSRRALGYLYRSVSWGDTDTPSLDENTDPETGLERVVDDAWNGDLGDEQDGDDFSMRMEAQQQSIASTVHATMGAGTAPALSATSSSTGPAASQAAAQPPLASRISGLAALPSTGSQPLTAASAAVAPWQFKDHTFPQFLERIGWTHQHFLSTSMNDADAIQEGHRYITVFLEFTAKLRDLSRKIAKYHPNAGKLMNGADAGTFLISEVHLLTGRLPWAKVAKRTRTDRDNDLLDSMQSLTTVLRRNLCRVSEEGSFGSPMVKAGGDGASESGSVVVSATGSSQNTQRVKGPTVVSGDGTANAPFEVDSSDDEENGPSSADRRSMTPRPQSQTPLAPITNLARDESSSPNSSSSLKRKVSQKVDLERRSRSHTPTPLQLDASAAIQPQAPVIEAALTAPQSPTSLASQPSPAIVPTVDTDMIRFDDIDDTATVAESQEDGEEGEEEEEGELTVNSAQKTVDSLWKACHFFCSPSRPRYSNVYGYNTFMITLTLHLISMVETLKHLHRTSAGRRYFQRSLIKDKGKAKQADVKTESVDSGFGDDSGDTVLPGGMDAEVGERGGDDAYSLTEETMRALNLGQMQVGFTG
ncbi:related to RNA-directed RNA polymerase [Sporisorium reilianum f. sp. reilianum]|uniref:Related to RNA-directed RNA polymerase n=1 Tax=Sporisorium reilianum f. sp. reilianum TaxID=72559 RepID=A0A2N8U7W5_9BASI|nr:related to RNA-directed RNA polymerase [Sporisorium reilianum f. sp. reilianum]